MKNCFVKLLISIKFVRQIAGNFLQWKTNTAIKAMHTVLPLQTSTPSIALKEWEGLEEGGK